jgi:hypothetical protein
MEAACCSTTLVVTYESKCSLCKKTGIFHHQYLQNHKYHYVNVCFNVNIRVQLPFVLLLKFGRFSSQLRNAVLNNTSSIRWTSTELVRRLFLRLYMLKFFVSLLFRHQRLPSFAYTNKPRWIPIKFVAPWFLSQTVSALHTVLTPPPPSSAIYQKRAASL